jgi:hypothetical protein
MILGHLADERRDAGVFGDHQDETVLTLRTLGREFAGVGAPKLNRVVAIRTANRHTAFLAYDVCAQDCPVDRLNLARRTVKRFSGKLGSYGAG